MTMDTLNEIASTLAGIDDAKELQSFLTGILTPKEIHDISSRWELVKRLDQGQSQRAVARDLGLSLCKITRGAKELKKKNSAIKKAIDRFNQIKRWRASQPE